MDDSDTSLPVPDPLSAVSEEDAADDEAPNDLELSDVPPEHRDVLRRLHRRVTAAATAISRLRLENERLRERVEELEAGPDLPEEGTVLALDDDPEALRGQITHFIDAIDAYLDPDASSESSEASNEDSDA